MAYKKDIEEQGAHPGWAIKFEDGTWLGGAHGWFRSEEAFYADIYDSKEEALQNLKCVRSTYHDDGSFNLSAEAVEAWQPICESLRHKLLLAKYSSKITIPDLWDLNDKVKELAEDFDLLIKKSKE